MNVDLYSSTLENMIKGIARESSSFYIPLLIFNRDMHIFLCVFYGDMSIVIQIYTISKYIIYQDKLFELGKSITHWTFFLCVGTRSMCGAVAGGPAHCVLRCTSCRFSGCFRYDGFPQFILALYFWLLFSGFLNESKSDFKNRKFEKWSIFKFE
jgi:hypothetical protein